VSDRSTAISLLSPSSSSLNAAPRPSATHGTRVRATMRFMRSALVVVACIAALSGHEASASDEHEVRQSSTVVFICEHGSSKSLVATALFNRIAEQRNLPVRAISRAVGPETVDSRVPPKLVRSMAADGFQVKGFQPQAVTASEIANASQVIVIGYDGELKNQANARVERWNDIPPASLEYDSATKALASHIEVLLRGLAGEH